MATETDTPATDANTEAVTGDESQIPRGATYLASLHDKVKDVGKHMTTEGIHHEHPNIKGLHGKLCKAFQGHVGHIRDIFHKTYPDIDGLEEDGDDDATADDPRVEQDEEAHEDEDEAVEGEQKSVLNRRVKTAAVPVSGVAAVKAAGDFLTSLVTEANLTPTQKKALLHTAGQLTAACSADAPDETIDPTEVAHLKALVESAKKRVEANAALIDRATGRT